MDGTQFDALARLFGSAVSRRGSVRAAVGAALGLASIDAVAKSGARDGGNGRSQGQDRPDGQGPCKTTKRPTNVCTSDRECCTNICDTTKGQKNKDRKGRCRCINRNQPCQEDRNCCSRKNQQMRCILGRCQSVIPTTKPCAAGDRCQDKAAICTGYADGKPAGTYCLIPDQGPCDYNAECVSESCVNHVCVRLADLAEPCGDSNSGAVCATRGATCTTYTYNGAPSGTFCLLPDNINSTVLTRCGANDQCRSGQCAAVPGDSQGKCAPLACSVCKPFDGVGACPYDSLQGYIDNNGSGGDLQVFEGQYAGQISFSDADWHVFPCCEDCYPEISPETGDSYAVTLDVNATPQKFITFERIMFSNFAGLPSAHFMQIWGLLNGGVAGNHYWLNLLLDRIKTNLQDNTANYIFMDAGVKVEFRDSTTKGLFVWSNPTQQSINEVTLTRSTLEGWGPSGQQSARGVYAETTKVTMVNSTIKNFRYSGPGAGVQLDSPDSTYKSSLTMDGTSRITGNTVSSADVYGWGVYAPDGGTLSGVTTTTVTGNGTTALEQCATDSTTTCPGF